VGHNRQARAGAPRRAEFQLNLGTALLNQGDMEGAVAALAVALSLAPNDPRAMNNLALAYRQQGRVELALKLLERAAELPDGDEARNNLALLRRDRGRQIEGARQYQATRPSGAEDSVDIES
jgi:type IV pilus assembly protein PilF